MAGDDDVVKALAGLFQAAALVRQSARHGVADAAAIGTSLGSLLALDAADVDEIYGGTSGLRLGLDVLREQLGRGRRDAEVTGYVARILQLERRLAARSDLMGQIRDGLQAIAPLANERGVHDSEVLQALANLYTRTVSTVPPRVMVSGEPVLLHRGDIADRVRALLLAALRSAVLWRQVGGTRLRLLLGRRRLLETAERLLEST